MTIELTAELEQDLCSLAEQSESSPAQLVQLALEEFVAGNRDVMEDIRLSEEDFKAGRTIAHEELFTRIFHKLNRP